jgi:hypothetical protein
VSAEHKARRAARLLRAQTLLWRREAARLVALDRALAANAEAARAAVEHASENPALSHHAQAALRRLGRDAKAVQHEKTECEAKARALAMRVRGAEMMEERARRDWEREAAAKDLADIIERAAPPRRAPESSGQA